MEIYLNSELLNDIKEVKNIEELLKKVQKKVDNKIIAEVYVNEKKINQEKLSSKNYNIEEIKTIKFTTKAVYELVVETLNEAENYLPKLALGIENTAQLFKNKKLQEANQKYQLCIEGLQWYTDSLQRIISLLDDIKIKVEAESLLDDFNHILVKLIVNFEHDDLELLADLLEFKVLEYIDKFKKINYQIKESLN